MDSRPQGNTMLGSPQKDLVFEHELREGINTLPVGSGFSFRGYAGQGFVAIEAHEAGDARIFVNGRELDVSEQLLRGVPFRHDISAYTCNKQNYLQVSGLTNSEARIRIQVPWPTIVDDEPSTGDALRHALPSVDSALDTIDTVLANDIAHGFPGAQLCVVKDGRLVTSRSYGSLCAYTSEGEPLEESQRIPIDNDTLFDLASMTKMFASNMALQKLVSEHRVDLDDPICRYLPSFDDPEGATITGKRKLTLRQVLEHQAGFQPDTQFFDETFDDIEGATPGSNPLFARSREATYRRICSDLPLSYVPGSDTRYSDTDYLIVGFVIEAVTGVALDRYIEEELYAPLGLDRLSFNPLRKGFTAADIAATELDGNGFGGTVSFSGMRTYTLQGEVHDPKAWYCMDGVAGHAGLFGTARQIAMLCQLMLNGGGYGDVTLFDKNTCAEFTKPAANNPTFGLGWRREADDGYSNFFGNRVSPQAYGHTGWTGTLAVIDPESDLIVVYLTNKLNTPLADPEQVVFGGTRYLSGQLGMAPFFVCAGTDQISESFSSLFGAMLTHKLGLCESGVNCTPVDYEVLDSLADMLREVSSRGTIRDQREAERVLRFAELDGTRRLAVSHRAE